MKLRSWKITLIILFTGNSKKNISILSQIWEELVSTFFFARRILGESVTWALIFNKIIPVIFLAIIKSSNGRNCTRSLIYFQSCSHASSDPQMKAYGPGGDIFICNAVLPTSNMIHVHPQLCRTSCVNTERHRSSTLPACFRWGLSKVLTRGVWSILFCTLGQKSKSFDNQIQWLQT